MGHSTRVLAALALALLLGADLTAPHSARAAEGQLVIGVHVTLARAGSTRPRPSRRSRRSWSSTRCTTRS